MSNELTPSSPSSLETKLESFITEQTQKIEIIREIVKDLKLSGNIHHISEDKLSVLTSLNDKTNSEVLKFRPPEEKSSFFSMMATGLSRISSHIGFKKENDFSWENLGYKVGTRVKGIQNKVSEKNISYAKLKENLEKKSASLGVVLKQNKIVSSLQDTAESFILLGTKKNIHQLNKKFKQDLSLLGFEAEDFFEYKDKSYASASEVEQNIQQKLSKKINLNKKDDNYSFDILDNLKENSKFEMISKVIWPSLSKDLVQNLSLAFTISDIVTNKSKDIKSLLKFSNKHNIHTDTIVHALKHNPDMLCEYSGYEALLKDKTNILKSAVKYDTLVENNIVVTKELLNATSVLKSELEALGSPQAVEFINTINNFVIGSKKSGNNSMVFNVATLERNIEGISKARIEEKKEDKKESLAP